MTGEKMREIREMLGLQQGEIAEHLGVNNETICRWERQNAELRKVVADSIERLATDPETVNKLRSERTARRMERRIKRLNR
jgi:DNA-binding transcriptional regulator YiaG